MLTVQCMTDDVRVHWVQLDCSQIESYADIRVLYGRLRVRPSITKQTKFTMWQVRAKDTQCQWSAAAAVEKTKKI